MPEDKLKLLYDAVSKDYDIGDEAEFREKLANPEKRKAFYEGVGAEYDLGSYDDFSAKLDGEVKKKDLSKPVSLGYGSLSEVPTSNLKSDQSSLQPEIPSADPLEIRVKPLSGDAPETTIPTLPKQSRAQKYQKAFDVNYNKAVQAKEQLQQLYDTEQITPEAQEQLQGEYNDAINKAEYFDKALQGNHKLEVMNAEDKNRFVDVGLSQLGSLISNSAAGIARVYKQAHPEQFANAKIVEDWAAKKADAQQNKADYYSGLLDESAGYAGKDVTDIYKEKGLAAAIEYSAKKFTESAPMTAYIVGMNAVGMGAIANIQLFTGTAEQKYRENEGRTDMSENAKLASALGYGTAELLFEGILTSGITSIAKDYIKTFGKDIAKKELKKTMFEVVKQGLRKTAPLNEILLESLGEGMTQLSENLIDKYTDPKLKDKDPMAGVIDASAIGAVGGSGFAIGTVGGALVNQSKNKNKLAELEIEKSKIESAIPQVSPQTAEILQDDAGKIQEQQNDIILKDRDVLSNKMDDASRETVKNLENTVQDIKTDIQNTQDETVKEVLQTKVDDIQKGIDTIYKDAEKVKDENGEKKETIPASDSGTQGTGSEDGSVGAKSVRGVDDSIKEAQPELVEPDIPATAEETPAEKEKVKIKEPNLPESQPNTRGEATKDLIKFAEEVFDKKFEGNFEKGEYVGFFQSLGNEGYEASTLLNSPKRALTKLKESPIYQGKIAEKTAPLTSKEGVTDSPGEKPGAVSKPAEKEKVKNPDIIRGSRIAKMMATADSRETGINEKDALENLKNIGINEDTEFELIEVPLSDIEYDYTGRHFRHEDKSAKAVREYTEKLAHGKNVPPVVLNEKGVVIDGNHRAVSHAINGNETIMAYVPLGTNASKFDNFSTRIKAQKSTPKEYYGKKFYKNPIEPKPTKTEVSNLSEREANQLSENEIVSNDNKTANGEKTKTKADEAKETLQKLSEEDQAHLTKIGESQETPINFREVANVWNKYGDGKPLSEVTIEDFNKAQKVRSKSKETAEDSNKTASIENSDRKKEATDRKILNAEKSIDEIAALKKEAESIEAEINLLEEYKKSATKIKSGEADDVIASIVKAEELTQEEVKVVKEAQKEDGESDKTISDYLAENVKVAARNINRVNARIKDIVLRILSKTRKFLIALAVVSSTISGGKFLAATDGGNKYISENISEDIANIAKSDLKDILEIAPNVIDKIFKIGSYTETKSELEIQPEPTKKKEETKPLFKPINIGNPVSTSGRHEVRPYVLDLKSGKVRIELAGNTHDPNGIKISPIEKSYGIIGAFGPGFVKLSDAKPAQQQNPSQVVYNKSTKALTVKPTSEVDANDLVITTNNEYLIDIDNLDITEKSDGSFDIKTGVDEENGTAIIKAKNGAGIVTKGGNAFHIGLGDSKTTGSVVNSKNLTSYRTLRGGMVLIYSDDGQTGVLVSGSVNDIFSAYKKIKDAYPKKKFKMLRGDTGSYSMSFFNNDGKTTQDDVRQFSNKNTYGKNTFPILLKDQSEPISTPEPKKQSAEILLLLAALAAKRKRGEVVTDEEIAELKKRLSEVKERIKNIEDSGKPNGDITDEQADVIEKEFDNPGNKKSGFQQRSIENAEDETVKEIARANEVYYEEMHQKEQYDAAKGEFKTAQDVSDNFESLFPENVSLDEAATLQVRRQVAMQLLSIELVKTGNKEVYDKVNRLQNALARDFAKGGQIGAMAIWKFMTPQGIVYQLRQKVEQENKNSEKKLSKAEKKELAELNEKIERLQKRLEEEIEKTAQRRSEGKKPAAKVFSEAKKARKEELRKVLKQKFFGQLNDVTNVVAILADKETLEYAKLVIEEGAIDFNAFTKAMIADFGKAIKPALAKLYVKATGEDLLDAESKKQIEEFLQKEFTKAYGTSKIPSVLKRKSDLNKIVEGVNSRVVNDDFYKDLFLQKFGMRSSLTIDEATELEKLAQAVTSLPPTSKLYNVAVMNMAQFINNRYPREFFKDIADTWVALNYAQMLSGVSTHVLNIFSTSSGILNSPFRNAVNLSKWVKAVREGVNEKSLATFWAYNPIYESYFIPKAWLEGAKEGSRIAAATMTEGATTEKYIEGLANQVGKVQISTLEQSRYGTGKRYKPVKIFGKDVNFYNLAKYVGRSLAAEDAFLFQTVYEEEIAGLAIDIYRKKGLRGKALGQAVTDAYTKGKVNVEAAQEQLDREVENFNLSGKPLSERDKKIRLSEIMVDMVLKEMEATGEQKAEAKKLALSATFNDDRNGVISRIAQLIGGVANKNRVTQLFVKPFVPFTKVVGNVTEFALDASPVYGLMRANNMGVTGIANRITKAVGGEGFETAQLGEYKSRAYYEQMARAWFGTIAFATMAMIFGGTDDDDEIQLTGGYDEETMKKMYGREKITPKYSIRIGKFVFSYLNIPVLQIPLGLIGNYNDYMNLHKYDENELNERMALAMAFAIPSTVTMVKDMSFVEGIKDLTEMVGEVASTESGKLKAAGKEVFAKYFGYATRPLPQNNNMLLQIEKFFDPTSYSRKDISDITSYSLGIQHIVGRPSLDIFGEPVKNYPAEQTIPYTHWFNLQAADEDWRYLARYNAIPRKIDNGPIKVFNKETDKYEIRKLEPGEFYEYTKLTGKYFREYLHDYQKTVSPDKRAEETEEISGKVLNGVEYDVRKIMEDAKETAKRELF